MIRCDDIFVDSDVSQFEKICQIIRRYDFDHIIGITPFGEGKKLWNVPHRLWKVHFVTGFSPHSPSFFVNRRLERMLGEKYIGNNAELLGVLDIEFNKYKAIPALHGLHHYRYDSLPKDKVNNELSRGIQSLKQLFNVRVGIFTPPFNAWNHDTESVCRSLNLRIDSCNTGFDKLIRNMNSSQIVQLAKKQSSEPEVYYHPQRLVGLEKFELYLKARREYC